MIIIDPNFTNFLALLVLARNTSICYCHYCKQSYKQAVCELYVAKNNISLEGHTRSTNFYDFLKFRKVRNFFRIFKITGYVFSIYDDCLRHFYCRGCKTNIYLSLFR